MTFLLPDANGPLCLAIETGVEQTAHRIVLPRMSPDRFTGLDLIYSEETPYFVTGYKSINHFIDKEGNGEMALLLVQTFFISKCIPPTESNRSAEARPTVIYIDAYPGDHINYLAEMFPHVSFRLYDSGFSKPHKVISSARIQINARPFTEGDAEQIAQEFGKSGSLYYISQLRNHAYTKTNAPERNSRIIDEDMWNQLHWAQIMKPTWSLIRYRPKLKTERPLPQGNNQSEGVSSYLTNKTDPIAKRSLYYNYPPGYFLRLPMAKKNPKDMHLITSASQTNNYDPTKTYYHDDMISLTDHQNLSVRRVSIFLNPYTDTYDGIYGLDTVMEYIKKRGLISEVKKPERYMCGAGWDHRAMFYIMTLYVRYSASQRRVGRTLSNEEVSREAIELILRILIEMELNVNNTERVEYEDYE